jgi:asparagine synthase (glutamine-hydrolysing)
MCGILGISSSSKIKFDLLNHLNLIRHRGPDDIGEYYSLSLNVLIGQVRLSILDTSSAGHQPMFDDSCKYVMVYNGEIYNFQDLKIYLESRYGPIHWKSSSDSEVIIEGFARENASFFEKLNGIFSILIYDSIDDLLHVIRDPIGVKPLYYTCQNGDIFFCSELKGLLGFKNLKRSVRYQSLSDQLSYMYVPEPYTMYNEFFKVEKGIHFTYRNGQIISETEMFKHLKSEELHSDENEFIKLFQNTFSKAIERQTVSDVPISLFLSGGLDSSAVAYESIKQGAHIHSAYTISYSKSDLQLDRQSGDLFYAKKVAKQLNLDLIVIEAEPNFMNLLTDLIPFMEDGISDPAAINTYLICKSAREDGIKVLLSGQGADEYLCGYRRYMAEKYIENMPSVLTKILGASNILIPNNLPGPFNAFSRRFKRLTLAAGQEEGDRLKGYFMWGSPMQVKKLFVDAKNTNPGIDLELFFAKNQKLSNMNKLLAADQEFDLLALNLAYSDKMSMMVGVEARVPFLDFDLVRLMNSIPINLKLKGNTQKYILKKSMEGKLSNEIIYRSKAGFALPIRSWFKQKNTFVEYYFNRDRIKNQGIFNADEIMLLYKQQLYGKKDNSYILFSILCQQIWLQKNF